jgi:hypothetical protein
MVCNSKIIFLNALVTSSKIPLVIVTKPINIIEVKEFVKDKEVVSFIGHETTASLLTQLLSVNIPMNRAMYDPKPGDVAVVVRLKKRLEKPEDVKNVTVNDIEFILVEYYPFIDLSKLY